MHVAALCVRPETDSEGDGALAQAAARARRPLLPEPRPPMVTVYNLLQLAITVYTWIIIGTAIASWLVAFRVINPYNPAIRQVLRVLAMLTEPVLRPIRRVLPTPGGLDFSPIVLLLVLWAIQSLLLPAIFGALIAPRDVVLR